jgi:antitoxin component of MazEF toxin-antitoxin module
MITQKLRKVGNSYVVTIPRAEVERQQLHEGDLLAVDVRRLEVRPALRPAIRRILEEHWEEDEPAYRYLSR